MSCPNCGAPDGGASFCSVCGSDNRTEPGHVATRTEPAGSESLPRLVACPACGAPNAASRQVCGRCRSELHGEPDGTPPNGMAPRSLAADETPADGPSGVLVLATVVAALAGIAVLVAILSARGIGPLAADAADVLGDAEIAEIAEIQASSQRRPSEEVSFDAAHVLDGDISTAWVAEDGGEPWLELELTERAEVTGVILWNGNQADDAFARHDRVAELRIETDDRSFAVDLLDARGPLAVELPEGVETRHVRLVVEEVFRGDEVAGPALSRVLVRVEPDG